jgi:hypothetical protein
MSKYYKVALIASFMVICGPIQHGLSHKNMLDAKYNLDVNILFARTARVVQDTKLYRKQISAYRDPSTIIFARTICGGEVASTAPRQEKLRILQVAERRAQGCGTTVGDELLKHMQFSAWNNRGLIVDKTNIYEFSRCLNEAVEIITAPRELWTANFYHAVGTVPSWDMSKMKYSGTSGGHKFYTSSDKNYCQAAVVRKSKDIIFLKPDKVKEKVGKKRYEVAYEDFVLKSLGRLKND